MRETVHEEAKKNRNDSVLNRLDNSASSASMGPTQKSPYATSMHSIKSVMRRVFCSLRDLMDLKGHVTSLT